MMRFPIRSYRLNSTFRWATYVTTPSSTKLSRYEIRAKLGEGGMGEVRRHEGAFNRDSELNG